MADVEPVAVRRVTENQLINSRSQIILGILCRTVDVANMTDGLAFGISTLSSVK